MAHGPAEHQWQLLLPMYPDQAGTSGFTPQVPWAMTLPHSVWAVIKLSH